MDSAELNLRDIFQIVLTGENGRVAVIRSSPFLFAAVNNNGKPALLARVSLDKSQTVHDGLGFTVQTRRSCDNDFVQITATEEGISSMFLKLVSFILEHVDREHTGKAGAASLVSSIEEFRKFTGARRGRVSESLVRGTFAEILLLRTLIERGFAVEDALAAWKGPFSRDGIGNHDFTFHDGSSIEVKSRRQASSSVRVSSVNQLVPSTTSLDLLVLPIEDDRQASTRSIGFREFVAETEALVLLANSSAQDVWHDAIRSLGLDLSDEWYDRYRFIVGEWQRFQVRTGFPYLDVPEIKRGITDIRYSLDLPLLRPFEANFNHLLSDLGAKYL
ncbi:PD-(D/E)XK motif protein [Glutamicibacter halophytocola]|uniref:PD-(D/E)XK motif protein n=1 Tax=Glutamicibacter halophytocola TaxID=1933880 RepID=A0AA94XV19_9MICC|nr:PD-(D/E)XK motif protein [Glutamicibacter halophytocola]UUX58712.1 PD-(D/E)XK motif protein [Glutamicibacter halophytocola]